MSWDELVAVALIGTDRRPVDADAPPGAPGELGAALDGRGVEDRLLASAAAWTVARRAGARAGAPRVVEPAEPDPRPLCSGPAAGRLDGLLEVRWLVEDWLALAQEHGVRPPPELVPALLDWAEDRPERYAAAAAAAGPLGRWLAAREPRWAYVLPVDEADWAHAEDRVDLLRRYRRQDPDAARELLASTWAEETWEDRQAFLQELEVGLSDADESLLELALSDRRKPVRDVAAALLTRLPRSAFAARAAAEALPLLRVEDGEIVATLPEARGRRSERLTELLAAAPLSTWDIAMVGLPVKDDLAAAVHEGWMLAALRQRDVEWGRALGLLELLPREEAEARAAAADDPLLAAEPLEWTWGPELSNAVVASVKRRREAGGRDVDVAFVGRRLDPRTDIEPLRDLGGRDITRLCDLLDTRAAMLSEFA
ncbi:DUF5691 domain-containing protein [Solirubrobacter deserti]|uniref:DUF5691 domain-containing protein n=1 Tax=Solirubrobacter deserti TaxID=2282478 RepID=A0ABT4RQ50_9ACTN|nr:DUF5691 domain-containing protein [Solirubrobacter deserti]MDA0140642.1 DUF5691 domain-containing protein [Solirubrobacter deserti]